MIGVRLVHGHDPFLFVLIVHDDDVQRVNVVMELPGIGSFDAVRSNARRFEFGDIVITVANIEDIITSKETLGRAKDWRAMDALYQARDHLRQHPDVPGCSLVESEDGEECFVD